MNQAKLSKLILRCKAAYYQGNPFVSDEVYDHLEAQLKKLDPNDPALTVGSSDADLEKSKFEKVQHQVPMLSLDKKYDVGELENWVGDKEVMETPKIDGVSCSLTYENGILIRAASRGRGGMTGFDLTDNIVFIKTVPKKLTKSVSCEVRGEVYMTKEAFEKIKAAAIANKEEVPANARNFAAGTLRQEDGKMVQKRPLSFFAYELIGDSLNIQTEKDKFKQLPELGFETPHHTVCTRDQIKSRLDKWKIAKDKLPYDIDGIVYKYNDVSTHEKLGATSHHPRYAMAFKWESEKGATRIVKIDWNTGRTGAAIPRATVEPIELSGATITHLTLHNYEFVKNNDIKPGSLIEIIRSGEVIPKFMGVIEPSDEDFNFPVNCETCGVKLSHVGVHLKCENKKCGAQALNTLLGFVGALKKSGYEIEELGQGIITGLFEKGLVSSPTDFYKLTEDQVATLQLAGKVVGRKTASKVVSNIKQRSVLPLEVFLTGLCIDGLGKGTGERLAEHFGDLNKILNATVEDISALRDFGETSADLVVEGLKEAGPFVTELSKYIKIENVQQQVVANAKCGGKTFVITGTLSQSRIAVQSMIKKAGGKIGSTVSSNTDYLVVGEEAGSKLDKAKQLGVKMISEKELTELLK